MSFRYIPVLLMLTRVKGLLGEQDSETSVYWTDAELYRYINDAYIEAAKATKALEIVEQVATTAGTATYTLTSNVGQVFRVIYDNRKIENTTKVMTSCMVLSSAAL